MRPRTVFGVDFSGASRVMLMNPGGDAIDAVFAALGAWSAFRREDLAAMASDPRVSREGWVFA